MHEPDPGIVAAARRGDLQAFAVVVRAYQADVWRFTMSMLHDETLAEDVTQDAFIKAFRFMHRYKGDSRFTTWLFSIARNCALDELRRSARRTRLAERVSHEPTPGRADIGLPLEVREALAELSLDLREPLLLIDMFGMPYAEVAKLMGVPIGTIKSRVHKGRCRLAARLGAAEEREAGDA
jgi:RNA polymerase sigma-70 factor (ECF subfamily)